ncbi:MAG: FAD/NAD(P)-binding oxidoreductase [Actinomycetota bacterium]|nr:FAD/NAD(P)-binding oxidoreductase [Actinomycetota bacterium]
MARIVVLGAGVAGHTAAMHAKRRLGRAHEVIVVSPNANWNWIPSNIWVGVGKMTAKQVTFPLAPVYKRLGIEYHQAKAVGLLPEGDATDATGAVDIEYTDADRRGQPARLRYDYLINATGPKLRFDLTPGLGPDGHSVSVCTSGHATQASAALDEVIARMKAGRRQTLVVGMGHGACTCEGAAFEYVFNVDHVLREQGVRELADVIYLTNEHELGDFGVGGMVFSQKSGQVTSEQWMQSLFTERGIRVILQAHVTEVAEGVVHYEQIDGTVAQQAFDFAMLLPPFRGVALPTVDRAGTDIADKLFAANGFMKVDADYAAKPYEEWSAKDWPRTYESPVFPNVFAVGIAFAPPHAISRPYQTPSGAPVAPAPPRTGMPSGTQGKVVAQTVVDRIKHNNPTAPARTASMTAMGAACIASIGAGLRTGAAATITMSPIVPDREHFPETGRDPKSTFGEIGLAGHWLKRLLHTLFIYKAKARPGWWLIPE